MYFYTTMTDTLPIDLTAMRERAGLTVREFARELGTYHTNVLNWEKAGRITKTEFIVPAASILGVTVEELLGLPKTRNNPIPGGKLGRRLRRRQSCLAASKRRSSHCSTRSLPSTPPRPLLLSRLFRFSRRDPTGLSRWPDPVWFPPNKLTQLVLAKAETIVADRRRRARRQAFPQERPSCTERRSEERTQTRRKRRE